MLEFHTWYNTPQPDAAWLLSGVRVMMLVAVSLLIYFVFRLWQENRHVYQFWLLIGPEVGVWFYYFDQLFLNQAVSAPPTPAIIWFNLLLSLSTAAGFTVADKLRAMIAKSESQTEARRRGIQSRWDKRHK